MTKLFAFPASPELHEDFEAVLAAFAGTGLPAAAQAPRIIQLAQRYSDEIVEALMLNLMKGADADSAAPKTMEKVASLIKGTVHALIRQVLHKLDNAELRPVAEYIASRRTTLTRDGETRDYISFTLSDEDYSLMQATWSRAADGAGDKTSLTQAMQRFAELSIDAFYVDSARAIKLGFIARNMFSVGHVAISKGSRTAINHLIPALKPREMKDFGGYFLGMLHTA